MDGRAFHNLLEDIKVELTDLFTRNFQTASFFGRKWKNKTSGEESKLIKSGRLRRLRCVRESNNLVFVSGTPYARIHNEGGRIKVNPARDSKQMRWARAMLAKYNGAKGKVASRYRKIAQMLIAKASRGEDIVIPQRQYVGDHTEVRKAIAKVALDWLKEQLP